MKTQEVKVDLSKLKALAFLGEVHAFSWLEKGELCKGVLVPVDPSKFDKVVSLLAGVDHTPVKGDKIFKLTPCALDDKMVKRIAARYGATVTDELEKATVFLGSSGIGRYLELKEAPNRNDLMFTQGSLEPGKSTDHPDLLEELSYRSLENKDVKEVFMMDVDHVRTYGVAVPYKWITPLGMEILHKKMSQKIPVVSEDFFISLGERVKMDEAQFEKIGELIAGENPAAAKVAREMLWQMDFEDPWTQVEFYLWIRGKKDRYDEMLSSTTTKRESIFLDKSNALELSKKEPGQFIYEMRETITKEMILKVGKVLTADLHTIRSMFGTMNLAACYEINFIPKKGLENVLEEI